MQINKLAQHSMLKPDICFHFLPSSEISTPILNDVKIKYVGNTISEDSLTDDSFHNYFDGSEIIVAGKLKDNSIDNLVIQVSATGALGYMELDLDVDVEVSLI